MVSPLARVTLPPCKQALWWHKESLNIPKSCVIRPIEAPPSPRLLFGLTATFLWQGTSIHVHVQYIPSIRDRQNGWRFVTDREQTTQINRRKKYNNIPRSKITTPQTFAQVWRTISPACRGLTKGDWSLRSVTILATSYGSGILENPRKVAYLLTGQPGCGAL